MWLFKLSLNRFNQDTERDSSTLNEIVCTLNSLSFSKSFSFEDFNLFRHRLVASARDRYAFEETQCAATMRSSVFQYFQFWAPSLIIKYCFSRVLKNSLLFHQNPLLFLSKMWLYCSNLAFGWFRQLRSSNWHSLVRIFPRSSRSITF